jgi:hypothetical protein
VKAGVEALHLATILPLVPESTDVGLRVSGAVGQVVVRIALTVVTAGKVCVNKVMTAAAVPITETSNSTRTHFVGIFIYFPPVDPQPVSI